MSLSDLQSQIDSLSLRLRALELEVRRGPPASTEAPSSSASVSGCRVVEAPGETAEEHGLLSWERCLELARCIGDFFLRCLEGANRGHSGQNQVGLPKRVYVPVRDKKANVFRGPVRVFARFSDIKAFVEVGSGLPSGGARGSSSRWIFLANFIGMSAPDEGEEAASEHEDVDGLPLGAWNACLVTSSGDQLEEALRGFCVEITARHGTQVIPVIPKVVVGGRLLIAVPGSVWHRTLWQRLLPAGALNKPALAVVAGVIPRDPPTQASSGVEVKVWVAYASAQLEAQIRAEEHEDVFEPAFSDSDSQACAPYSASLIQLADDHFSFITAESEAPHPSRGARGKAKSFILVSCVL